MLQPPVITIDGPGGTGKGTVSHFLARKLSWHFLDSGSLYRVLALAAMQQGIDWQDEKALQNLALNLDVEFVDKELGEPPQVILGGHNVTKAIRSEECGAGGSKVGALPAVRAALLERQRAFRQWPGLVTDGRDMGTVIFPDAPLKFFLTASREERAKRRFHQLKDQGINASLPSILQDLTERDSRDQTRSVAPLRPAADAVVIDTTNLDVDDVFAQVVAEVNKKGLIA